MFNYLANQPDALDLANRITNSRAQQLQNAIYAAQAPQIQAQTAYTQENTRLLPQQRDAAMMAALARYTRVPYQNYADTAKSLTPGTKAQNIADNAAQVAAINKQAIDALQGGVDPFAAQMLQKYGMIGQPQAGGMQVPQNMPSPMMMQQPQMQPPQAPQSSMVANPQGQNSTPAPSDFQNAAMTQDPNDPNSVPVVNSPSTPASNLKTVGLSESQQKSMTDSQKNKLPYSQNLGVTIAAMKQNYKDATALAGSGLDIPGEYGKMAINSLGGSMKLDPRFIKYKTYMDSLEQVVNQLRQTYGASIQPGQLEHFREMFTPNMIFDTPATANQKLQLAFNNIDNELKTFKQPVSNLVSDQFTQQQQQDVAQGTKQIQQEALQGNSQVGNQSAIAGNNRIRVTSPDGKSGSIPSSRLQEFIKKGYKAA